MSFEYDSVYNLLFDNKEFVENLSNFHTSIWEKLSYEDRLKTIKDFSRLYSSILKIDEMKMKKNNSRYQAGSYYDIDNSVYVQEASIKNGNQYDILDTLFHELRHNFQHRAMAGNLTDYESVTEKQLEDFKLNFLVSPSGYRNYISNMGPNSEYYYAQPVEEDAFKTGLACTKKSYQIISEKLGEDTAFVRYARTNYERIQYYFSNDDAIVKMRNDDNKKLFEIFNKNSEKIKVEVKCFNIAKKVLDKEVKDLTMEELVSLFSIYVWGYIEDNKKVELLKEYDKRVNPYYPVGIKLVSNSGIKICTDIYTREDISSILNSLFSAEFSKKADSIIKGKEKADKKLKQDLEINLYKKDGKEINFIKDRDNFLLYSIQPYAVFEGKVIVNQFKQVAEAEYNFYKEKSDEYAAMIDFYDYNKYIPFIEKFYGKSFKDIYNDLLNEMKKKISVKR